LPPTTVTPFLPTSVSSSSELESTITSIFCVDCDVYHVVGPNDLIWDHDDSSTSSGS
jgi:hypothetical protein